MFKPERFAPRRDDSEAFETEVVPIDAGRAKKDLGKEGGDRVANLGKLSKLFDRWTQEYGSDSASDALQEYIDQLQVGLERGQNGSVETALELLTIELKVVRVRMEADHLQSTVPGISKTKQELLRTRNRLLSEIAETVERVVKSVRGQLGGKVETADEESDRLQSVSAEGEVQPLSERRQAG